VVGIRGRGDPMRSRQEWVGRGLSSSVVGSGRREVGLRPCIAERR
jgi:hypothetical protein